MWLQSLASPGPGEGDSSPGRVKGGLWGAQLPHMSPYSWGFPHAASLPPTPPQHLAPLGGVDVLRRTWSHARLLTPLHLFPKTNLTFTFVFKFCTHEIQGVYGSSAYKYIDV